MVGYQIAETLITIEFVLIGLIILTTYTLRFFAFLNGRREKKIQVDIDKYITSIVFWNKPFNSTDFPTQWHKLPLLLLTIDKFDQTTAKHWLDVRNDLIFIVMLPLARVAAFSKNWIERYYAVKAFGLAPTEIDLAIISILAGDSSPLVALNSISSALRSHSDVAVNVIITRMARQPWKQNIAYLRLFDNAPLESYHFVKDRLLAATDPETRATCYNILGKYPPSQIEWDMSSDLKSDDINLKIAALKFITRNDEQKATPELVKALQDPVKPVRIVALHRLGMIKASSAIAAIASCLTDKDWAVKLSAAQSLKNMGDDGINAIRKNNPDLLNIHYHSTHTLNTSW